MSGAKAIQLLMRNVTGSIPLPEEQAGALWVEVRARLKRKRCMPTIREVEACASGQIDTHPREIVMDAMAFVLTGYEYWPSPYPGSTFAFDLLKECIARGYIESDGSLGDEPDKRFAIHCDDGVKPFKQLVVRAEHYDELEAEVAELRRQLEAKTVDPATQLAANRWNALMSSARISLLGWSGFKPSTIEGANQAHLAGHRHFGCDMWSHHDVCGEETTKAREMFATYADHLIELNAHGRLPV